MSCSIYSALAEIIFQLSLNCNEKLRIYDKGIQREAIPLNNVIKKNLICHPANSYFLIRQCNTHYLHLTMFELLLTIRVI